MSDPALNCHDYVNHPYPRVRDALLADPYHVFQHATGAAESNSAALHVRLAGVDIGAEVAIEVVGVEHDSAYDRPATKIALEWRAANSARIFPTMKATLVIFALTATETQLELRGVYDPPMGKLGDVIDAAAGYRLAEASVTRFLQQVAAWLREALAEPSAMPAADARPGARADTAVDIEC